MTDRAPHVLDVMSREDMEEFQVAETFEAFSFQITAIAETISAYQELAVMCVNTLESINAADHEFMTLHRCALLNEEMRTLVDQARAFFEHVLMPPHPSSTLQ